MGINAYREFNRNLSDGTQVTILKNLDVVGDSYRIDNSGGEGANTRWFPSLESAISALEEELLLDD